MKKHWLWIFVFVAGAAFLSWGATFRLYRDEVEHLHCAYLVSQGLLPYKDFWQHHAPLIWVLLAPALKWLPQNSSICVISRFFCLFLTAALFLVVWKISKLLWKDKADLAMTSFVFLSISILSEFLLLRPDLFMMLFSFSALYFSVKALEEKKDIFCFFAGFCLSLGFSFSPKLAALFFILPFCSIFLFKREPRRLLSVNGCYFLGLAAGLAPLLFYLYANGLLADFYRWVIAFHYRAPSIRSCGYVTFFAALAIGFAGLFLLKKLHNAGHWLFMGLSFAAVLLTTIILYPLRELRFSYYLGPLFVMASILSSGISLLVFENKSRILKIIAGGLLGYIFLFPNVKRVVDFQKNPVPLTTQLKLVDWLISNFHDQYAVVLYPWHPIYAKNVGLFYTPSQLDFLELGRKGQAVKDYFRLRQLDWVGDILDKKPALIAKWDAEKIMPVLKKNEFLTRQNYERLQDYLKSNYKLVTVYGAPFYVRIDYGVTTPEPVSIAKN